MNEPSITGTWAPKSSIGDGEPTPEKDLRGVLLTFSNGECEVRREGSLLRRGTWLTDTATTPHTIDVCFTESDVPELIDAPLRGIYAVTADELRICYGPPGGYRASSFCGDAGTGQYLANYHRVDGEEQ